MYSVIYTVKRTVLYILLNVLSHLLEKSFLHDEIKDNRCQFTAEVDNKYYFLENCRVETWRFL